MLRASDSGRLSAADPEEPMSVNGKPDLWNRVEMTDAINKADRDYWRSIGIWPVQIGPRPRQKRGGRK